MYISLVIQRLFAILLDEERTLVGTEGFHADIVEMDVAGMVHPESFGRQDAPHRGFGIFRQFLIGGGSRFGLSSLLCDKDVAQKDVLHGMALHPRYGTTRRPCIADHEVGDAHIADAPHLRNLHRVAITAGAIGQTYKDWTFSTFHRKVRDIHILHHAAIDNLQREGTRATFRLMAEELRTLV